MYDVGGVESHKGFPNTTKAYLLIQSLYHEIISHSLVVDFKVVSKSSQNSSSEQIHNPDASMRPYPPRVFHKLKNNKIAQ
jgi:hypothetical protein